MLMAQLATCISLRLWQAFRKTALRRPCGVCKWKPATSASLCWQPPACKMHPCSSETLMSFGHRQTNCWNLWLIPRRSRGSAQFCSFWTPQTVVFVLDGDGMNIFFKLFGRPLRSVYIKQPNKGCKFVLHLHLHVLPGEILQLQYPHFLIVSYPRSYPATRRWSNVAR